MCVPNKVEARRSLPRKAMDSEFIYYTRPGRRNAINTFQVRPRRIYELCAWLNANAKAYQDAHVHIIATLELGGITTPPSASQPRHTVDPASASNDLRSLDARCFEHGEQGEVEEDTGNAPQQTDKDQPNLQTHCAFSVERITLRGGGAGGKLQWGAGSPAECDALTVGSSSAR